MIIVLLTSFVHCEEHPVPPSSLPWHPRKKPFWKTLCFVIFFFSCCFQDLSSTEDIRLADGHSFKEVIIFGLKFPPLLIMALKTSCHNSKISQPLDIRMLILGPSCSCLCMRPTDGILFKKKKKAALLSSNSLIPSLRLWKLTVWKGGWLLPHLKNLGPLMSSWSQPSNTLGAAERKMSRRRTNSVNRVIEDIPVVGLPSWS